MLILLRVLCLAFAVVCAPLSLILLSVATTREGQVFAVGGLLAALTFAAICFRLEYPSQRWFLRIGFASLFGWVFATVWLVRQSPDGHTLETAKIHQRYVGDDWNYRRYALGNLLPEVDQFMLGFQLVPAIDTYFTRRQATVISALTFAIYADLERDADFHALGSAMPEAYDDMWGRAPSDGHYFHYIPASIDRTKPSPVMVFLHGSGGNFKAYTWLLSVIADRLQMMVIAPSYGMGNWRMYDTHNVVSAALKDSDGHAKIDTSNVHLISLSNGGLGATQLAAGGGIDFKSLVFLSPVFDADYVETERFAAYCKARRVLIMSGKMDDRVPSYYVEANAAKLKADGVEVSLNILDAADHFMLFSHKERVLAGLEHWLAP